MKQKKKMVGLGQVLISVFFLIFSCSMSGAEVTLSIGNGFGLPGSTDREVEVSLDNSSDAVGGVQFDLCDDDNYLTLTACETTIRTPTPDFTCSKIELPNGCARIILFSTSESNSVIEEGTGSIALLKYQVEGDAPEGACRALEPEGVIITLGATALEDVVSLWGQFCFTATAPTTTTTTPITTTVPVTTTIPVTTTTTTAVLTYKVTISPQEATVGSETTLQFAAKTTYGGEVVAGSYLWEIVPPNAIGSAISTAGLFNAGENATATDIDETVKVTDTAHENKSATATVTVKIKEEPPPECTVKVNPSTATVTSGESLALSASTVGDAGCAPGEYEWSITTQIGSVVDQGGGNYTAGNNTTATQATDTVTVVDHANLDISGTATIKVEPEETPAKSLNVFPETLLGSRWIPLPYLLIITSEDAVFELTSNISFEPGSNITPLFQVGFGNIFFALVILNADPAEGTVTVTITTTGEEIAVGEISIQLLPFGLQEGEGGRWF